MRWIAVCLLISVSAVVFAADEPKEPKPAGAVLIDANGKEVKLDKWKFSAGTRRLSWLEGSPEVLEFRELNSTTLAAGVLTLVPLDRIKSVAYDYEKKVVSVDVAGRDEPLKGFGQFLRINEIAIDAEVDRGDMGVAELRYKSGLKGGFREIRLGGTAPKEVKEPGELARIVLTEVKKGDEPFKIGKLQVLYRGEKGAEKVLPTLHFKRTLKVDLSKIERIKFSPADKTTKETECDVTFKDGTDQTLTLFTSITVDGKPWELSGLVGEVPGVGWKLFPLGTLSEVSYGDKAEPTEKP